MGGETRMTSRPTFARLLTVIGAVVATMALLAPVASAAEPNPGYTQFAGCPSPEENPEIAVCLRSEVTGGHFQMGTKDVPITKPIIFSGGYEADGTGFDASPKGGLLPAKQLVPGGIIGLTGLDWLVNFLGLEDLKLYAVTELAGEPSVPIEEPFKLPIKVHLINPVLGNNCYVGSNSNPIQLNLITGTTSPPPPNKPITGKLPEFGLDPETEIASLKDGIFVDNSFSAPGASGCKLTLFGFLPISINGLVNSQSGLPAAAGTNETEQEFDGEAVQRSLVYP
jgi:hypothetical protein